ncbi:MAG: (d)CMP kinase [Marinifilaceae bacterium]
MSKDCKHIVIAIDGHSSTGKSTVAKQLAAELGLSYIDTGAMYRVVTLAAMRANIVANGNVDEKQLEELLSHIEIEFKYNAETGRADAFLNGECVETEIRRLDVSGNVSHVAAVRKVRNFLVDQQRLMGQKGGVVMDGRDIGSVVFPNADVKFFMTASPQVRAQRRYDELLAKGEQITYDEVERNVLERDHIDENRAESPLIKTDDAILVDNSDLSIAEELEMMKRVIKEKCSL